MRRKFLFAACLAVAGVAVIGASAAHAPPRGTEQFEEWFDASGNLNGYVRWRCDGQRDTWGTRQGTLVVTQIPCPSAP